MREKICMHQVEKWIKWFDFYFKLMILWFHQSRRLYCTQPTGHSRVCKALMWSIFSTVSTRHSVSADVHYNDIIPSRAPNIFLNVQSETFNRGGHISKLNCDVFFVLKDALIFENKIDFWACLLKYNTCLSCPVEKQCISKWCVDSFLFQ